MRFWKSGRTKVVLAAEPEVTEQGLFTGFCTRTVAARRKHFPQVKGVFRDTLHSW